MRKLGAPKVEAAAASKVAQVGAKVFESVLATEKVDSVGASKGRDKVDDSVVT